MEPKLIRLLGKRVRSGVLEKHAREFGLYQCPVCKNEFESLVARITNGQQSCSKACGRAITKRKVLGKPKIPKGRSIIDFSPVDFKRICRQLNISRANYNDKDLVLLWNERTDELLPRLENKGESLEILGEGTGTPSQRLKELHG
jgi:ribosomal protein L37AE/L43A